MTNTTENTQAGNEEVATITNGQADIVISKNDQFVVKQKANGKFKRTALYSDYTSIEIETSEDAVWLAQILTSDEDTGNGLKDQVGKQIVMADRITRQYDKINEDTGEIEYGVLNYLITSDRQVFVTSSKTVQFTLDRLQKLLGAPHEDKFKPMILKVTKKRGENGDIINVQLMGLETE